MELEEVIGAVREALGQPVFSCADEGLLVGLRDCETVVRLALARQLALIAEVERRGLPGNNIAEKVHDLGDQWSKSRPGSSNVNHPYRWLSRRHG